MRLSLYEQLDRDMLEAHTARLAEERRQRELAELRRELVGAQLDLAIIDLKRNLGIKYDSNQPRVPAGQPEGGRWTAQPGRAASEPTPASIIARARRLNLAARPDRYPMCLDLCYPLLERYQPPWSDRNENDFHSCMRRCLESELE
jgi:hypothetical protein